MTTFPLDPALRRTIHRDALSIGLATGTYALSFGALATVAGFSIWQTQVLSLLLFSGASQFAFVSVLASGGSLAAAVSTSALLGLRNGLYGIRIVQLIRPTIRQRFAYAHFTIDESTAMANKFDQSQQSANRAFISTGLSVLIFWNLATLIGSLLTQQISTPEVFGLDAAIGAGFLALVAPRLKTGTDKSVAIAAVAIALLLTPFLPAGIPILLSASAAVIASARQAK